VWWRSLSGGISKSYVNACESRGNGVVNDVQDRKPYDNIPSPGGGGRNSRVSSASSVVRMRSTRV
jgi:hypothetical protein